MKEEDYIKIWKCSKCESNGKTILHDGIGEYVEVVADCPECGADSRYQYRHYAEDDWNQTGQITKNHPDVLEMYRQMAGRSIWKTFDSKPLDTMLFGMRKLFAMVQIWYIYNPDNEAEYVTALNTIADKIESIRKGEAPYEIEEIESSVLPESDEPIY